MSRKPALNLQHGFLKGIRRQLQQQADEFGLSNTTVQTSRDAMQMPPGRIKLINNAVLIVVAVMIVLWNWIYAEVYRCL